MRLPTRPCPAFALLALALLLTTPNACRADAHDAPPQAERPGLPEWIASLLRDAPRAASGWQESLLSFVKAPASSEDGEDERERESERTPTPTYAWTLAAAPSPRLEASRAATGVNNAAWTFFGPQSTYWSVEQKPALTLRTLHANITAFAVAPTNTNVLYAGSERGSLSKSTEKGLLWTPLAENDTLLRSKICAIAVAPNTPNVLYLSNDKGVLKSTNGGANWSVELGITQINAGTIAINPSTPADLLVSGVALFSKRAGLWDIAVNRQTDDVAYKPGSSSTAYALVRNAAGDSVQFFKSTDSGATWSIRRPGWSANVNALLGARMAVTPAAPNRIYVLAACVEGMKLLRSDDSGDTWVVQASSTEQDYGPYCQSPAAALTLGVGQGYYDLAIAASPTNADQIIFGTCAVRRSLDGGVTSGWDCGIGEDFHTDVQEMVCLGSESWIVTDGGVNYSTDFWNSSANFASRTRGLRGTEIWGFGQGWNDDFVVSGRFHNSYSAWYEGYPAGSFLTTGSGEVVGGWVNPAISRMSYLGTAVSFAYTWPTTLTGTRRLQAIAKWPYENGFGAGNEMNFGDQEWDPRYAKTYYVGNQDGLWRTTDNGTSFTLLWNHTDPVAIEEHIEVSRTNPDVIYVTVMRAASGELWKSVNGGKTFTQCANPSGPTAPQRRLSQIALSGTDANELWWCFRDGPDGNKVYRSTDGGQSWTNLTTPTLNGVVLVNMYHQLGTQGGIYLIGGFGAVLYRNDLMADWQPFNSGLPASLAQNAAWGAIHYPKGLLRLGTTAGIWQTPLFESSATLVQPMAVSSDSISPCDTLQLESYSVTNGPASYHWSFDPAPLYVSDANIRNPRVVFGTPGMQAVTLEITDLNGTTSRTIPNFINAGGVQYADAVVAKSSEYDLLPPGWLATQVTGPPDTYPQYGDIGTAWATLNEDDPAEFLQLHFPSPRRINFVQLYETLNPGALTTVSVKIPNTSNFMQVWSAPAVAAPPVARVNTVRFTDPGFPVDEVRLNFGSELVPGWNEVDAVGIGFATCTASLLDAAPAPTPLTSRVDFVGPNPFASSSRIHFSLARAGRVKAEVFDVNGRRVALLEDRRLEAGPHEASWNGRSTEGREAASGVYFVRVDLGGFRSTARLVKLK